MEYGVLKKLLSVKENEDQGRERINKFLCSGSVPCLIVFLCLFEFLNSFNVRPSGLRLDRLEPTEKPRTAGGQLSATVGGT